MTDMTILDHETCGAWLSQAFQLDLEGGHGVTLRLEQVNLLGGHDPERSARQPFALEFSGPMEPLLQQQIYRLDNTEVGELELFLVPVGPQDGRQRYEAVFT